MRLRLARVLGIAAIGVLLVGLPLARAQDEEEGPPWNGKPARGFYLGGGVSGSFVQGDVSGFSSFDQAFGPGFGFQAFVGAPLTDNFFTQVNFAMDFYDGPAGDLQIYYGTAELKIVPLPEEKFSPYLLFGIGGAVGGISPPGAGPVVDTDVEFTFTTAIGADFYLTRSIAFEPEARLRFLNDESTETGILKAFPVNIGGNFIFIIE
ncbi:MAG: outer membrane beta-barrel protein [Bdellovibrionota bacterium]